MNDNEYSENETAEEESVEEEKKAVGERMNTMVAAYMSIGVALFMMFSVVLR